MRKLLVFRSLLPIVCAVIFCFMITLGHAKSALNIVLPNVFVSFSTKDSLGHQDFIIKKIIYEAPKSGAVYLSWYVENYSKEVVVEWNHSTKISENKLFTPMHKNGNEFWVEIAMPKGTQVFYGFFIAQDEEGVYQNFWDWKHNSILHFNDNTSVIKKANYAEHVEEEKSKIIGKGWLVFVVLSGLMLILFFVEKMWFKKLKSASKAVKIVALGLAVYVFHVVARSEIVSLSPKYILTSFDGVFKIFKAGLNDLFYVSILVAIFMVLHVATKQKKKLNQLVYLIFVGFAIVSVLVSFTNIETVAYLGQPFNYEWLYYSDFLGSDEAKNALGENLSVVRIFNLLALMVAAWFLSKIFQRLYKISEYLKYSKYTFPLILVVVFLGLFLGSRRVEVTSNKGKTDNAILAMLSSLSSSNVSNSFFTLNLPSDYPDFVPNQGTPIESPLDSVPSTPIKNVLFVVLESSGAEYFDLYGGHYQLNPNLNQLAEHALIFKHAYAHAPGTVKSLVSILGSMYPYISYKSLTYESPNFTHPSLSSVLKNRGYRTSFFSSSSLNYQSSDTYLGFRGFDEIKDFKSIGCTKNFKQSIYDDGNGIDDMCLADQLALWLDKSPHENFFSVLWTQQGHYPYFFSGEETDYGVNNLNFNKYLNIIKHNDDMIGAIMQNLKDRNLEPSTLVVVVGDHGESFGQHGQYGHGSHIYEENLKVPLLFINSQLFSGQRRDDIASMKDLAATVLSILNIEIPDKWQGRDLVKTQNDEAFFFAPWSDYLFGFRKGNMKFIFNESNGQVEVYNLALDPKETNNLFVETSAEDIEKARRRIASWVQYHDRFVKENFLKTE